MAFLCGFFLQPVILFSKIVPYNSVTSIWNEIYNNTVNMEDLVCNHAYPTDYGLNYSGIFLRQFNDYSK